MISTFAGTGTHGFSGDGGPATSAQLSSPAGMVIAGGALYIGDTGNSRLRAVGLFTSCADEGYTGTRLTSLIKLYMSAYRAAPPCAR